MRYDELVPSYGVCSVWVSDVCRVRGAVMVANKGGEEFREEDSSEKGGGYYGAEATYYCFERLLFLVVECYWSAEAVESFPELNEGASHLVIFCIL